jgi:hypothetical protein
MGGANVRPDMYGVAAYMARERGSAARYCFCAARLDPKDQSTEDQEAKCHCAYRQLVQHTDETRQESNETLARVKIWA